jgi:hypothetical protein
MSGVSELRSQRGNKDDDTSQYGTFHDRLIRSKRYYDNLTIGTNLQHEGALQQGFLGVAEVAGIVGFGCTRLSTGLRVRSDRIVAMGVRVVRMKLRPNDCEPRARRTSPPG